MSQPQCSIVIRAFNEEQHIARLLTGILEQTVKDVQIILVDDLFEEINDKPGKGLDKARILARRPRRFVRRAPRASRGQYPPGGIRPQGTVTIS